MRGEIVYRKVEVLREKQLLLFLSAFLFASAAFLILWFYVGEFYQYTVFSVAAFILNAMGYSEAQISAVNLTRAYLANFNLVPLIALAVTTPRIAWMKRVKMLAIGFPVLFSLHVLDIIAHFPMYFHDSEFARIIVYSLGVVGVAAPFIIWFVLIHDDLSYLLGEAVRKYSCPICGAEMRDEDFLKHIKEAHGKKALKSKKVKDFIRKHPEMQRRRLY